MDLRVCGVVLHVWASSSHFCFFFAFLLLLRGKFVVRILVFADVGGKRCREVAGLFMDHLIRKHFLDQVDSEDAYGSSDP